MTKDLLFDVAGPHPGAGPGAVLALGAASGAATVDAGDRRAAPPPDDPGPIVSRGSAARRGVTLTALPARTALVRQEGPSASWFDWSANPYRGCEFGCGYCYARGTHQWLGHTDPADFQDRIYVKQGFAAALRRDLRTRVRPGEHVAFGTATDPYQPVERREGVLRAALREMMRASGLRISITTKSTLVVRDADILLRLAERNAVQVNFTVTTADARLARFLEPRAPTPAARLDALRAVRDAGLRAGVFLMPVLPGITDAESDLRAVVRAAADAGAQFVAHQTLFLEGPARSHFIASLRRAYPRIAARYEVWTRCGRSLPLEVRSEVAARVRAAVRESRIEFPPAGFPPRPPAESQRCFEFVA